MSFCTYKLPLPLNLSVHCKHNIYLEYNIIFKSLGFYNHRTLLFYILQPVFILIRLRLILCLSYFEYEVDIKHEPRSSIDEKVVTIVVLSN